MTDTTTKSPVQKAVEAAFADQSRWRATLDQFGTEALNLLFADQYFDDLEQMAGESIREPGKLMAAFYGQLTLDEVFHLHGNSEPLDNMGFSFWDCHIQELAMERVEELFALLPYEQQLRELKAEAQRTRSMPSYQGQLIATAASAMKWPENVLPLVKVVIYFEEHSGDDDEFRMALSAVVGLIDLLLPDGENVQA